MFALLFLAVVVQNPYEHEVNAVRKQYNLRPLVQTRCLRDASKIRAREMATAGRLSHTRPNGTYFYTGLRCGGSTMWRGENIAHYWFLTAQELLSMPYAPSMTVNAWMNSPSHKNVLLSPKAFRIGVSVVNNIVVLEVSGR